MLPSQTAAYHPEELSLLGQVLDSAVEALPPGMRTASNRMAIARNIFKLAATGVRDPFQLQLAATMDLKIAAPAPAVSNAAPSPSFVRQSYNRLTVAAQLPPFRQTRMASSLHE